ncbi:ATP-binding protein, partial [Streptomyces sp. 150FB]|uniref:ATP-binding protein n=1 Tax=Streptomyces sp. 150FB TaxID=1576605 RepID=UPI001364AB41
MAAEKVDDVLVSSRETELAHIERSWERGAGALLTGAPGVGRTTLLDAALARAERRGAKVVRLGDPTALAPVLPLQHSRVPAQRAAPRGEPFPLRPGGGEDRPVIGVDDIHLIGPRALEQVHRLAGSGRAVLVATASSVAPLPDGVRHLLLRQSLRRIEVGAFDRSGSVKVLTARLGGAVAAGTAEKFWDLARGNARALRELTDSALEDGTLRKVRGRWQWPGLGGTPDGRLVALSELFLGPLSAEERELVSMLAVAGSFEAGLDFAAELGVAAESLNQRGVVVAERRGFGLLLRLAHPLCAAVLRGTLPELTTRRLRLVIAEGLEHAGVRSADDAARISRLRLGSGWIPEAAQASEAAEGALRCQDFALAEDLCRAVLPPGGAPDTDLAVLLAGSLAGQRRHGEAEALYAEAAEPVTGRAAPSGLVGARALNMAFGLGRPVDAEALVDVAAAGTPGDGGALAGARSVLRLVADRIGELCSAPEPALGPGPFASG